MPPQLGNAMHLTQSSDQLLTEVVTGEVRGFCELGWQVRQIVLQGKWGRLIAWQERQEQGSFAGYGSQGRGS